MLMRSQAYSRSSWFWWGYRNKARCQRN